MTATVLAKTTRAVEVVSSRVSPVRAVVYLFVFSAFLVSNDSTLKIASINASAFVSVLMLGVAAVELLGGGSFRLKRHPLQGALFLVLVWAGATLVAAKLDPWGVVPWGSLGYAWAEGLNSPALRGAAFLGRLFLAVFAVEFIVSVVRTERDFTTAVNVLIAAYTLAVGFGVVQVAGYLLAGVKLGHVVTFPQFRAGGYVGEPQTFGLLLLCGLFPVIGCIVERPAGLYFTRGFLKALALSAALVLISTFSVSMIFSVLATLVLFRRAMPKGVLTVVLVTVAAGVFVFRDFVYQAMVAKLTSEVMTMNSRTLTWSLGYAMMSNNPFMGVGIGNSPLMAGLTAGEVNLNFLALDFQSFRVTLLNTYIEWAAETGLVGLGIVAYAAVKGWLMGRNARGGLSTFTKVAFGGALAAMLISANSYGGFFYTGCMSLSLGMYLSGLTLEGGAEKP